MSRARVLRGCEPRSDSGATRQTDAGAPGSQTGGLPKSPSSETRQPHLTEHRAAPGPERGPVYTQLTKKHSVPCAGQRAGGGPLCEHGGQSQLTPQPRGVGLGGARGGGAGGGTACEVFPAADSHCGTAETKTPSKAVTLQVKTSKC